MCCDNYLLVIVLVYKKFMDLAFASEHNDSFGNHLMGFNETDDTHITVYNLDVY